MLHSVCAALLFIAVPSPAGAQLGPGGDVVIRGGAARRPQLFFACDGSASELARLFSGATIVSDLEDLHAGISLALAELDAGRAQLVRRLNGAGIPVTAWLALPGDQGYYMNAGNFQAAAQRFAAFVRWTGENQLRWDGIGLDIEPDIRDFAALQNGRLRLAFTLIRRLFDIGSVGRARNEYSGLIRQIHAQGYRVETYQFPFLADERKAHSTVLERLTGIVDVRGDREVLMLYSSFNPAVDGALIWEYGPEAQAIAIGSTAGDTVPQARFRALDWNEFSRELMIASRFTSTVGVYNLQGCVHQGFLPRLKTIDWNRSVTIPAESLRRVSNLRKRIRMVLWTASNLPWFVAALIAIVVWLVWRCRLSSVARRSNFTGR